MTALADAQNRSLFSPAALNRRHGRVVYWTALALAAAVFFLVFAFPLYWMAISGLKGTQEVIQSPPTWFPRHLVFSNYSKAWEQLDIATLLLNTLVYAGGALAFQLVFSVTAAFSLSKLRPVFGNVVLFLMLATLMVPASVLVLPTYLTVLDMPILHVNLINSPWAIWLPSVANGFNIFILKRFFDSLPEELLAAAAVDGAGPVRTLWSVVLPMSRPILGVVSIFAVVAVWKDFLWPLLVLNTPAHYSINIGLYQLSGTEAQNVLIAALMLSSLPMIVFFLIFQRHIMSGLTAGALKG
jgi:multiple sugar transport system permease protein